MSKPIYADDLLSRIEYSEKWNNVKCPEWVKGIINNMPKAQQEQKTGKWIYLGDGYKCPWSCSECDSCSTEKTDYCPDCGAKLEI